MRSLAITRSCLPPVTISPASSSSGWLELLTSTSVFTWSPGRSDKMAGPLSRRRTRPRTLPASVTSTAPFFSPSSRVRNGLPEPDLAVGAYHREQQQITALDRSQHAIGIVRFHRAARRAHRASAVKKQHPDKPRPRQPERRSKLCLPTGHASAQYPDQIAHISPFPRACVQRTEARQRLAEFFGGSFWSIFAIVGVVPAQSVATAVQANLRLAGSVRDCPALARRTLAHLRSRSLRPAAARVRADRSPHRHGAELRPGHGPRRRSHPRTAGCLLRDRAHARPGARARLRRAGTSAPGSASLRSIASRFSAPRMAITGNESLGRELADGLYAELYGLTDARRRTALARSIPTAGADR